MARAVELLLQQLMMMIPSSQEQAMEILRAILLVPLHETIRVRFYGYS